MTAIAVTTNDDKIVSINWSERGEKRANKNTHFGGIAPIPIDFRSFLLYTCRKSTWLYRSLCAVRLSIWRILCTFVLFCCVSIFIWFLLLSFIDTFRLISPTWRFKLRFPRLDHWGRRKHTHSMVQFCHYIGIRSKRTRQSNHKRIFQIIANSEFWPFGIPM